MNMMETMSGRCQTAGNVRLRNKRLVLSCRILDCLAMIRCFEISVCRKSSLELIRKALIKSTGIAAAGWSGRTGTQKVNQLSGGQRQRVAICRALAMDAEVIVADEPTGALDLSNTESLMDLLERLNKQGITVIIVTHDPYVANRCTMEYVIEDGKLSKHA